MRTLTRKTWRDIRVRKGQFIALVVLVSLGITSYVAFVSSYRNLEASAGAAVDQLLLADFTTHVVSAPDGVVDKVRKVPGVAAAEGRLVVDAGLDLGDTWATVRLIGIPSDRHPRVNDLLVEQGDYLRPGAAGTALLHSGFSEATGKGVGDRLTFWVEGARREVTIVGTATSAEYIYAVRQKGEIPPKGRFAVLFIDLGELQQLFHRPGQITDVSVLLAPGVDRDAVAAAVEDVLGSSQIVATVMQEDQPGNYSLLEEIRQNKAFAQTMPFMILLISASSMFITMSRLVRSQRGEIGLAKALGYGDGQIMRHYLLFTLLIAVAGTVIGFGLGQLGAWGMALLYIDVIDLPFLESRVYPDVVATAVAFSVGFCVLGGLVPAWTSARLRPAVAMRADPAMALGGGKTPLFERMLGRLLPHSFVVRVPLRNVFRSRRRSLAAVVGIAFAMVLTVTTWALFDTTDYLMDNQFNHVETWDVSAVFDQNAGMADAGSVASWTGVERVQGALVVPARLSTFGGTRETSISVTEPDADFHHYSVVDGDEPGETLAGGRLVVAARVADELGVGIGDPVAVTTPYTAAPVELEVGTISDERLGLPVFAGPRAGALLRGDAADLVNALYLSVDDDADADEIERRLYALHGVTQVTVKQRLAQELDEMLSFLYSFGGILLAFGFAIAFVVIYTTFTANVLERTREIATMRTIGEDNGHLALMITLENAMLALVGIPIGGVLGFLAARWLFGSLSNDSLSFVAVVKPGSYVIIVCAVMVVLLLSEIPPTRRIFKLDLAQATKVVE
jgi:putative ABC transport system permease protein